MTDLRGETSAGASEGGAFNRPGRIAAYLLLPLGVLVASPLSCAAAGGGDRCVSLTALVILAYPLWLVSHSPAGYRTVADPGVAAGRARQHPGRLDRRWMGGGVTAGPPLQPAAGSLASGSGIDAGGWLDSAVVVATARGISIAG